MARPQKEGIDYFPFDVGLLKDIKLRKVKIKYGYVAVMIYISLLSLLYRDKGYYIDYSDKDLVIWEVLEDLQGKYQPSPEIVAEVIEDLVACGLFSGDQFKSKIITSKRSQETYYSATVERKTINIIDDIWLISLDDMKKLSAKHCYYLEKLKNTNNEVNRPNNEVNRPKNPQSKVKESKVKESRVEEAPQQLKCISVYEQNINLATPKVYEAFTFYLEKGFEDEMLCAVIEEAVKSNGRSLKYIESILLSCESEGVFTLEQFENRQKRHKNKTGFNDFDQRDDIDFEQREIELLKARIGNG